LEHWRLVLKAEQRGVNSNEIKSCNDFIEKPQTEQERRGGDEAYDDHRLGNLLGVDPFGLCDP
jgi:hypothetical protein